jgi:uncharacterized protein HemX
MIKKIVIGIIITTVLSLGAVGFTYAYQKEQAKQDAAALAANNKNEIAVQGTENKHQYRNAYGKIEKMVIVNLKTIAFPGSIKNKYG